MLLSVQDSPAVRPAHAVALAERDGALVGLAALERVRGLDGSAVLPATRAELLLRAGRPHEALTAFDAALYLALSGPQRARLHQRRRAAVQSGATRPSADRGA